MDERGEEREAGGGGGGGPEGETHRSRNAQDSEMHRQRVRDMTRQSPTQGWNRGEGEGPQRGKQKWEGDKQAPELQVGGGEERKGSGRGGRKRGAWRRGRGLQEEEEQVAQELQLWVPAMWAGLAWRPPFRASVSTPE